MVVAVSFAVLVEDERDADQKGSEQERQQLARLRPQHGAAPLLAEALAHHHGLGQQLGEGDEDEGPGADQQDDGDVRGGHGAAQREDDDGAEDGGQGREEVVGEGLRVRARARIKFAQREEQGKKTASGPTSRWVGGSA